MTKRQGNLAVIPARGGSKRLQRKNVLSLCGRPLIEWTIEAAQQAYSISRVIVSTDCKEIARVAESAGAEVPFMRPAEYSGDDAPSLDVLSHTVGMIVTGTRQFESVVLLQPTSPLRTSEQIDEASEMFFRRRPDSVISITSDESGEGCTGFIDKDSLMSGFPLKEEYQWSDSSQQLYKLNGAIYVTAIDRFSCQQLSTWGATRLGYRMEANDSVDIDTFEDFVKAEKFMHQRLAAKR